MIKKLRDALSKLKYAFLKDNRIGIIKIEGIILDTGSFPIATKVIESFEKAKILGIKNILIKINSPGGTVGASQEIYREIVKARKNGVKVVVSMGDVAASGGLYIAAAGDRIVSNPGTITGSIGVMIKTNVIKDLYKKIGIDSQVVKSGEFKDILSHTKYLSDEEKRILQDLIDSTYSQFVDVIAENRNISVEDVRKFADGRVFSGAQAKELGLVDEIGSLSDAVDILTEFAQIKEEPVKIDLSPKKSILQKVTGANLLFYENIPMWLMDIRA